MSDDTDRRSGDGIDDAMSRRALISTAAMAGVSLTGVGSASAGTGSGERVFFQYFHETWPTITDTLSTVADRGYDGVWIQAPQESELTWSDQDGRNDPPLGYQPVDFRSFDSEFGTEADLNRLVETAHEHGLEVYVDCVMNHMAANRGYDFPQFKEKHFHTHVGSIDDWDDEHQVEHGNLLGLKDLAQLEDHGHEDTAPYVREQLYDYMKKIADTGADGYRYDAVKHVEREYWEQYANQWADEFGMSRVGEVFDGGVDYVQNYIDTGMNAFDYPLYFVMEEVFDYGDMSKLDGAGVVAQDPFHSWPFVQNHDEGAPPQYHLAHAFVLTIEGTPMVYNLYPDEILDDDAITNMVWVKTNLAGGTTYWRHTDSDLAVYERQNNLLVGLNNNTDSWRSKWVYTTWSDETLKDYSGNADDIDVNGDGWVEVSVPPEGWVFYAPY
ncbi:alpha amylase catalytic region [Haloterrigena turkmenica DSM 5511]|uniref:Alpha amylase catalytic region n=1 Tax=Haloterrigena turkmenica (strain ATCC 51198 / DSM 5511 / JCM 9101 / NCIMB 13204 / VKM B-1734 / 4k) TaxID=543526 RepID=D2RTP2_HALTV|nr:alpha-amylase domain-containing protein [Haloterrigena turkmenica]ADB60993.1 alpha amylase catalytic region [Haloterrigena turkmenica DSM 5511]